MQAGAIHGLVIVLKDPEASQRALAHASFVLKRLTATKYVSRTSFVTSEGPAALQNILRMKSRRTEYAPLPPLTYQLHQSCFSNAKLHA